MIYFLKRAFSLFLAFVVCSFSLVLFPVYADELDALQGVIAYENDFRQGLIDVNRSAADAVSDSNLSSQEKSDILTVLALQELALCTMQNIYGFPTDPILPNSDTVSFSGSGTSGLYRTSADGDAKVCNLICVPTSNAGVYSTFISAPDFTFRFEAPEGVYAGFSYETPNYRTPYYECGVSNYTSNDIYFGFIGSGLGLSEASTGHGYGFSRKIYISYSSIPVISSPFYLGDFSESNPFLGYGVYTTLPDSTVDTTTPWDYYNNKILPDIQNNYSSVTNNYIVFPNGYTPVPDPTEPVLFPYTQPWYNDNFVYQQTETSVSVVNPTATNNSGSTFTETTIVEVPVTDTTTSYVPVYGFNVPFLPDIQTVTATIPRETVDSNTAQNIGNIWAFIKWVLDNSGLFSLFLAFASIGFVLYILHMLGG